MEISRDSRRASVSVVNGLPRRRQRITTLRTDQDRQVELQETVRLGGEGDFPNKRRIDRSSVQQRSDGGESYRESSRGLSDEESYEEEEEVRINQTNQSSPASSDLSVNRRGLCKLRSSPVHRAAADEMFGGLVPRRARSSSAKRLHEYCSSGSASFGEDLSHRRFSQSSASLIGSGDSMKKKMRSLELRTVPISNPPKLSAIQDDIEIEVAEALFDLMKQSQPQTSEKREKVESDKVIPVSHELKKSKADGGEGEKKAVSAQNQPPIKVNAETVLADSTKERKKEGKAEREKFSDEHAQDLVSGDGFVNKAKVGPPKESESPSCVVNASDTQDPTVTKAHYDAIIVEARKESKLEIDLMASPLPSSPERVETDTGVITEAVPKKSQIISNKGPGVVATGTQEDVEKLSHDITQQQQVRKEYTNQSPTSLLPSHFGTSSWPGVLPHPGYMHPLLAVTPVYGSAKSPLIMQPPQFKFSASRPKRCATQQYLAESIHCHQQLIKKSLSSGSTAPAALSRAKSPNPNCTSPAGNLSPLLGDFLGGQNMATASVGSGKDKSSDAGVALNATASSKSLLQQALYPPLASRFLPGHGFILPYNHHQATVMAPANSSGSPQSASMLSNSAVSLNLPMFHTDEATPYMAMLQNNGCSIPNISIPTFKGGPPSMAFFNPLYPSLPFNPSKQQLTTSHASVQSASQNTNLSSHKQPQSLQQTGSNSPSEKPGLQTSHLSSKSDTESNWRNGAKPSNLQTCSLSSQPMNFAMIPTVSKSIDGGAGNKQNDHPQQGYKSFASNASVTPPSMVQNSGMFQMLPDMSRNGNQMMHHKASEGKSLASGGQSFNYSKSDGSEISALPTMGLPKFDGLARNISFLPSSLASSLPFQTSAAALSSGFQQHQLIQVHDHHMHLAARGHVKSSTPPSIPGSFFHPKWESFPRSGVPDGSPQLKTSSQGGHTHINFGHGPISASSYQGHDFAIKSESMSSRPSSNPSLSRSSQRNAFAASTASALASQEAEASQGLKSSPACRRNAPSILSASPSQLPELKH